VRAHADEACWRGGGAGLAGDTGRAGSRRAGRITASDAGEASGRGRSRWHRCGGEDAGTIGSLIGVMYA
jgi:hypothetical protein